MVPVVLEAAVLAAERFPAASNAVTEYEYTVFSRRFASVADVPVTSRVRVLAPPVRVTV
ncbi:hypothetical protein D3C74_300910 [compost metagenome]